MAIDIWIGDKHTDRINLGRFATLLENEPALSFEDVNCDGYKDTVLHSQSTGYDEPAETIRYAWYLYDPEAARFGPKIFYQPIPFTRSSRKPTINCENKTVFGIITDPKDDCIYEKDIYRWTSNRLDPLRIEVQKRGHGGKSYLRTTEDWSSGKKKTEKQTVPKDSCHP